MVVDSHAHACGEYLSAESIEEKLRVSGCDKVILCPGQYGSKKTYAIRNRTLKNPYADTVSHGNKLLKLLIKFTGAIRDIQVGNEYVHELTEMLPGRVYQSYWVTRYNYETLEYTYDKMRFIGLKLHQCWEDFEIDDDYFKTVSLWAEKKGIPLFIHVYSKQEMLKLIDYIGRHPALKVVIGHLFCMEDFFILTRDALSNVYFDLSNINFVSKERLLLGYEAFGGDRFILGSDTPYGKNTLEDTIAMIKGSGIPKEDVEKICGTNAAGLYGLK